MCPLGLSPNLLLLKVCDSGWFISHYDKIDEPLDLLLFSVFLTITKSFLYYKPPSVSSKHGVMNLSRKTNLSRRLCLVRLSSCPSLPDVRASLHPSWADDSGCLATWDSQRRHWVYVTQKHLWNVAVRNRLLFCYLMANEVGKSSFHSMDMAKLAYPVLYNQCICLKISECWYCICVLHSRIFMTKTAYMCVPDMTPSANVWTLSGLLAYSQPTQDKKMQWKPLKDKMRSLITRKWVTILLLEGKW